jgi:hypothetical protein
MADGLGESNKVAMDLARLRGEGSFISIEENRLPPGEAAEDAAVGGGPSHAGHRSLEAEGGGGREIKDKTDVAKCKEPSIGGRAGTVHDHVSHSFYILVLSFSGVLVLVIRLGLPVTDAIRSEDILNAIADFDLCPVAKQSVRSTASSNIIFKGINELFIGLHGIDIANEGFHSTVELGTAGTGIDGRRVRINSIGSNCFVTAVNIKGRKGRFVTPFHVSAHGHRGMLRRILKGFLNYVRRKPGKVRTKPLVVNGGWFYFALVDFVHEIASG